jgi:hypothetical protein
MACKLISADSHVRVKLEAVKDVLPQTLREAFDDAIARQASSDMDLKGGREMDLSDWDMEAFGDPGYWDPEARLAAMDRDGVQAEVLYSEVSAFRHFGLITPSTRFSDLLGWAPAQCTCRTSPQSWAFPTITMSLTIPCGRHCRRPASPSLTTWARRRTCGTYSDEIPRPKRASTRRFLPWLSLRLWRGGS